MAKLERIELVKVQEWDDRLIEGLIAVQEQHGIEGPVIRYRASLIDRTRNETQPQYGLYDDEDLRIRALYLADTGVNLGIHATEDAAIASCQAHHDSIYGEQ